MSESDACDEAAAAMERVILAARAHRAGLLGRPTLRHRVWFALRQRGYTLGEIASVAGVSRERVRVVVKRLTLGGQPSGSAGEG